MGMCLSICLFISLSVIGFCIIIWSAFGSFILKNYNLKVIFIIIISLSLGIISSIMLNAINNHELKRIKPLLKKYVKENYLKKEIKNIEFECYFNGVNFAIITMTGKNKLIKVKLEYKLFDTRVYIVEEDKIVYYFISNK